METKKSDKFLSTLEAAQKGDADAQFNLGFMYENVEETEQNYAEAYKYYRLAAEQGNIGAQVNLGLFYS